MSAAVSTIPILAACSPADDERPLGKTQDTGMAPGHPGRANTAHTRWNGECVRDRGLCRQNGQYLLWWILVLRPDLLNISLMDTICRVIYCQDLPCRLSEIILTLFHHTTSRGNISSIVFNQLTNFSRQFPTLPQFLASQNTKWPFLGMKNHLEIRLQCGKVMKLRINKLSVSWEAVGLFISLCTQSQEMEARNCLFHSLDTAQFTACSA